MLTLPKTAAAMLLLAAGSFACAQGSCPASSAPVWGFADLHSHPASFLGFGADANGNNGALWGKPAHSPELDLTTSSSYTSETSDLPQCPAPSIGPISLGPTHNNATSDPVTLITDAQIVAQLDQQAPGFYHQPAGYSTFSSWPAALTVDHQVMHINNISRAYQGGLRLIFAAAVDDELISKLWHQGFNVKGNSPPQHDPNFDYNSAVRQLTYITQLVNANNSWMQIVTSPAEARAAINCGKLAVVLSLEMDSLSLSQIQSLVQHFGVAHVIPVHLADNSFGGTAVYMDEFNGLSNFINGTKENTTQDANVDFVLGTPVATLQPVSVSTVLNLSTGEIAAGDVLIKASLPGLGNLLLQNLPQGAFGYQPEIPKPAPPNVPGEINSRDLNKAQFFELMQMGLLLDVAHMGQKSASTALNMALQYNYPLMDSHTGIRCDSPTTTTGFPAVSCTTKDGLFPQGAPANERSLPTSQVAIIHQIGGVIGLGVSPPASDPNNQVVNWLYNYSSLLDMMGGHNVALGTDADGMSPMISGDSVSTSYPITVMSKFGCPLRCPVSLPQYQFGTRTYNFEDDGIANYGMLPDFIQAVSLQRPIPVVVNAQCQAKCQQTYPECGASGASPRIAKSGKGGSGGPPPCPPQYSGCIAKCPSTGGGMGPAPTTQVAALYHSAEDTIEMWEKVKAAVLITTPASSNAPINQAFTQTLLATGGTPPYKWSLQSGSSLPAGLTLNENGVISGTVSKSNSYSFTVDVEDSATPAGTASQRQTIDFMTCVGYCEQSNSQCIGAAPTERLTKQPGTPGSGPGGGTPCSAVNALCQAKCSTK